MRMLVGNVVIRKISKISKQIIHKNKMKKMSRTKNKVKEALFEINMTSKKDHCKMSQVIDKSHRKIAKLNKTTSTHH